jgi:hypothetical protein
MSSTTTFTKAKEFAAANVTYKAPTVNKRGGKNVQVQLDGQPLVLQIPLMFTWGLNERVQEDSGRLSYDIGLVFDADKHSSIAAFLENMKELEEKIKNDAVTNSKLWFGKNKMSRDIVDVLMYPILKYPKDKESGELDLERNPTLKLKVPFWEDKFNVELYDMNRQVLYLPPRKGAEPEEGEVLTPMDHLPKGTHIKGLIQCTGLWFAGGKWGVTWKLVQAMAKKPVRLVGSGKCQIADDSDDEELSDTLNKQAETTNVEDSGDEAVAAPTFSTDDEEEEAVATPPPAPKKKKKVVRRKKTVQ